jgi:hypothetical protein
MIIIVLYYITDEDAHIVNAVKTAVIFKITDQSTRHSSTSPA